MDDLAKRIVLLAAALLILTALALFLQKRLPPRGSRVVDAFATQVPVEHGTRRIAVFDPVDDGDARVPKILHQTAPADRAKWHPIWEQCAASWRRHFPDWTYVMWDDDDLDRFMRDNFPDYYPIYAALDAPIKRVDVARYFILYALGGMYADMDYMCYRNFEHLLPPGRVSIAESMWTHNERFQNALMASPARHPFWLAAFAAVRKDGYIPESTGPVVLDRAADSVAPTAVNPLPRDQFSVVRPHDTLGKTGRVVDAVDPELLLSADAADAPIYAAHQSSLSWISQIR